MKRETIVMLVLIGIALLVAGEHFSRQTAFDKRFTHMTSFAEGCDDGEICPVEIPRWTSDLRIGFFNASQIDKQDTIRRTTIEFGRALTEFTTVDLQLLSSEPNVLVISFDQHSNELLAEIIPPFFGFPEMQETIAASFERKTCGTSVLFDTTSSPDAINAAFVYINPELKDGDLDACILERLVTVLGLVNDPPGQASLFDNGNFSHRDGRIWISSETEAMLKRIYEE